MAKAPTPSLYLVPTSLAEQPSCDFIAGQNLEAIQKLNIFIVENEKPARTFLKQLALQTPLQEVTLIPWYKHDPQETVRLLEPHFQSRRDVGLLSDCGSPCIADPGAEIVLLAHRHNYQVRPLTGPCSITLALMASGLPGQRFTFHGYVPLDEPARSNFVREIERTSKTTGYTQICMDTPYRTNALFKDFLRLCDDDTMLSVARNLTDKSEAIETKTLKRWREHSPEFGKEPAIFCLAAYS